MLAGSFSAAASRRCGPAGAAQARITFDGHQRRGSETTVLAGWLRTVGQGDGRPALSGSQALRVRPADVMHPTKSLELGSGPRQTTDWLLPRARSSLTAVEYDAADARGSRRTLSW